MGVFGLASWFARSQCAIQAFLELGEETFIAQRPPRAFVGPQLLDAMGLGGLGEELVPIAGQLHYESATCSTTDRAEALM